MKKEERYKAILHYFAEHNPDAKTELHYGSPFQLLVAVILSAQCTDKRVNQITPQLFARFPDSKTMAAATEQEILRLISSVSYPNSKSRYLKGAAQAIENLYGGTIPDDIDQLQQLPGVGRKTANVILSVVYGEAAMAVDTHVFRVANRLGLTTNSKTPLATEKELLRYIPQEQVPRAHHWLILHGRYVCQARKPQCTSCGISQYCKYFTAKSKKTGQK
jgi:endonuclease-3